MNDVKGLSPKLSAWLEAMPYEAPDRVMAEVMTGIGVVKQQRPRLFRWTFAVARPSWLAPVLLLIALLLAVAAAVIVGSRLPSHRQYSNQILPVAPMVVTRAYPVVVGLSGGQALVIGGTQQAPAAEVVDASGSTRAVPDPTDGAALQQAYAGARLPDGRVFVLAPGEAWVFDPERAVFSDLPAMTAPRVNAAMVLLSDGKVLVTGGYSVGNPGNSLPTAEIFDPLTNQFTKTADTNSARQEHEIVALPKSRAVIFGGVMKADGGRHPVSTAELFDETTGTFTLKFGWNGLRVSPIELADGRIALFDQVQPYMSVGQVNIYDVDKDEVEVSNGLPYPVRFALPLDDERVLLAGGEGHGQQAAMYDPITDELTNTPALGAWSPSGTVLSDGRVLLARGLSAAEPTDPAAPGAVVPPPVSTVELFQ